MKKEIIIGSGIYEPTDKFLAFLKELGYDYLTEEARVDDRVVEYIKKKGDTFRGYIVDTGKQNNNFKIGFSGLICIIEVDTEKDWVVGYDACDIPYITYIDVFRNEYGRFSLGKKDKVFPLKKED